MIFFFFAYFWCSVSLLSRGVLYHEWNETPIDNVRMLSVVVGINRNFRPSLVGGSALKSTLAAASSCFANVLFALRSTSSSPSSMIIIIALRYWELAKKNQHFPFCFLSSLLIIGYTTCFCFFFFLWLQLLLLYQWFSWLFFVCFFFVCFFLYSIKIKTTKRLITRTLNNRGVFFLFCQMCEDDGGGAVCDDDGGGFCGNETAQKWWRKPYLILLPSFVGAFTHTHA